MQVFKPAIFISIALGTICLFGAQALAENFLEVPGDYFCPANHRLMSVSYAQVNKSDVCDGLKDWAVARLAGDGSISGPGNNCEIYQVDHRDLGSSLCVPLEDFSSIRGVLLQGGFRTQDELNRMSDDDWRDTLKAELANRTAGYVQDYDAFDNDALAGVGALLVYLLTTGDTSEATLVNYNAKDMRRAVTADIQKQTGIPLSELQLKSDLALIDLILKG